ncbi:MAG: hypothetical protein ABSE49_26370 [Polyangiaceae bacterium]
MTRKLDGLLATMGVLFGASSLAWPFGWDTSVHYYVGREWLLRGAMPYRDSFDHKTPGIHAVHALAIALFGEGTRGIRVVELACIAVIGWACGSLAERRGERRIAGLRGASVLAASVLYYGCFDFYNTAQCELLGTTLCILALLGAWRVREPGRAALVAGLVTGALFVLKPPLVLVAAVPLGVAGARAMRGAAPGSGARAAAAGRAALVFAGGTLFVPALFVAYFAAHGALADLVDVVVWCNLSYLREEPRLTTAASIAAEMASVWRVFSPMAPLLFGAAALATGDAVLRRSRARMARWAAAWAMLALGVLVIVLQLKFYFYHWTTPLSAVVLLAANVMVDAARAVRASRRAWVPVATAAVLLAAFTRTGAQVDGWWGATSATLHLWRGDWDRARFARHFQTWDGVRQYADLEATGLWLRAHASAGDLVAVRGVATEVYVVSGMRAPGRFFWTTFLTRPSRRYRREEWLAEDAAAIDAKKPRWAVTSSDATEGPESEGFFARRGYAERTRIGPYTVLERRP